MRRKSESEREARRRERERLARCGLPRRLMATGVRTCGRAAAVVWLWNWPTSVRLLPCGSGEWRRQLARGISGLIGTTGRVDRR
uniref:Uncharacterized protein n=1 Tax=Kalanchoe fedtschenkoi TaxID=63787 RepID=A0A7N0SXT1_KALFE